MKRCQNNHQTRRHRDNSSGMTRHGGINSLTFNCTGAGGQIQGDGGQARRRCSKKQAPKQPEDLPRNRRYDVDFWGKAGGRRKAGRKKAGAAAAAATQQELPTCPCGRSIASDGSGSCCVQCPKRHTGCCRKREARESKARAQAGTNSGAPYTWCSCGRTVSQTARWRHTTCCLLCPNAHTPYCERREQGLPASSATTVATVGGANASRGARTVDAMSYSATTVEGGRRLACHSIGNL